jgi:hypothetical protein
MLRAVAGWWPWWYRYAAALNSIPGGRRWGDLKGSSHPRGPPGPSMVSQAMWGAGAEQGGDQWCSVREVGPPHWGGRASHDKILTIGEKKMFIKINLSPVTRNLTSLLPPSQVTPEHKLTNEPKIYTKSGKVPLSDTNNCLFKLSPRQKCCASLAQQQGEK